jgi:hypothetical protein
MADSDDYLDMIESLFEELIQSHQEKLLALGRKIVPTLTPEDILQPNDYPELENNPHFRYEEGLLAGIQTAFIAIKAKRRENLNNRNAK